MGTLPETIPSPWQPRRNLSRAPRRRAGYPYFTPWCAQVDFDEDFHRDGRETIAAAGNPPG
jgi:hypothetical protein